MLFGRALILLSTLGFSLANVLTPEHKPRIFVLSDMANEPDDAESLVRLLLYANEIQIEGLVATTSTWLRDSTHEEQIHNVLDGYAEVLPNLQAHTSPSNPYPSAGDLASVTYSALPLFGMQGVGSLSFSSPGSDHLIATVDKIDPYGRPLFVQLWGGANCLAQALWEVRESRSKEEVESFVSRIRVYAISDQDDAGPWIRREFPELSYIASVHGENQYALATWTGISGDKFYGFTGGEEDSITMEWVKKNIQLGALGKKYPDFDFIMEGDTPAFLGTIPNGLNYPLDPTFGGWGGRYTRVLDGSSNHYADSVDRVTSPVDGQLKMSAQASIWRWRKEYQNDFAARIQWTLTSDFFKTNHPPSVLVNGDDSWEPIRITIKAGSTIEIDASASSDPDGNTLEFEWFQYKEVGSIQNEIDKEVPNLETHGTSTTSKLKLTLPEEISWRSWFKERRDFHMILKVTDDGTPALTRYRRIIITVLAKTSSGHDEL
ncbi:hypothetical protein BDY24DRAFT_411791 [Mrakia frigida]|uniref:uncharacterized protein n=1 Tax=Mrakia frigida TaxID=29902 RepID=UPI003FCBFFF5